MLDMYFSAETLYGPLHSKQAVEAYKNAIAEAVKQGGKVECGGKVGTSLSDRQ